MCLGIPGRVLEFVDEAHQLARVEVSGVRRIVHVGLVVPEGLAVNDWVLIHVGFALSRIDEEEAARTLDLLRMMGDTYEVELQQLKESRIE